MKRSVTLLVVAACALASDALAWQSGGPYGARVRALAIDPTSPATLYAGTYRTRKDLKAVLAKLSAQENEQKLAA